MASPGKSPYKPPHCQLRGTITFIKKKYVELQLAALSTYATEANGVNMVLTGNRALRESLQLLIPWNQLSEICRNESFYHRARQELSAQTATGNKTCCQKILIAGDAGPAMPSR